MTFGEFETLVKGFHLPGWTFEAERFGHQHRLWVRKSEPNRLPGNLDIAYDDCTLFDRMTTPKEVVQHIEGFYLFHAAHEFGEGFVSHGYRPRDPHRDDLTFRLYDFYVVNRRGILK